MAARHPSGDLSRIEELAALEAIPANYLVQILGELRNGGIIESRRGKQGGYLLSRAPEDVSLKEVITLIHGDAFSVVSKTSGASGQSVARAWKVLQDSFEAKAESLSLLDLVADQPNGMYYI